jgi:ribosome maturation factor RimP
LGRGSPHFVFVPLPGHSEVEIEAKIEGIISREIELLGFELVKLESLLSGRKKILRLYIDRPEGGVGVDDCARVSKVIGFVLDGEDFIKSHYNLEVSSPGMNRPLTKPEHFRRFAGMTAKVVYRCGGGSTETVIGQVGETTEEDVTLVSGGEEKRVAFENIVKANLHGEKWAIPSVKKPKEGGEQGMV